MLEDFYPLICALLANICAQLLKPLFSSLKDGKIDFKKIVESGGFPSSHTSMVIALTTAMGIQEGVHSSLFTICLIFSLITLYDAANVRYYAGQNIAVTRQLIQDIEILTQHKFNDPVYRTKLKSVLGHKWIEVMGGLILGTMIPIILYFIR